MNFPSLIATISKICTRGRSRHDHSFTPSQLNKTAHSRTLPLVYLTSTFAYNYLLYSSRRSGKSRSIA